MATQDFFRNILPPSIEEQKIELERLVQQGEITPEMAQAALVEESAFEGLTLDPKLKENQMKALASLQEIGDGGGMTAVDRANLNKIITGEQTASRGARDAIIQNANARGVGGSGLELAAQLQNQQDSATRANQRGLDVAAQAQQRALEAIMQSGQLSGNIRGQDFDEQAKRAQAADQIAQFNAANRQQMNTTNTAARNNAQMANLQNKQNIANQNVSLANEQQMNNKNLIQQNFDNKIKRASGQAGISQANSAQDAAATEARKQRQQQMLGTAVTAAAMFSDENLKENVEEFDPSAFLDEITGYRYNYKNQKHGSGPQVGIMAQDLEKGAPQAVKDTPEGKTIDYNKMGGPILAALSDVHERLKKIEGV